MAVRGEETLPTMVAGVAAAYEVEHRKVLARCRSDAEIIC